jgi:hypothetical protein
MRAFWRKGEPPAISNAQRVGFHWEGAAGPVRRRWPARPKTARKAGATKPENLLAASPSSRSPELALVVIFKPVILHDGRLGFGLVRRSHASISRTISCCSGLNSFGLT